MKREVRCRVRDVRYHPTDPRKIQVLVEVPMKGGGKVKEWHTPLMRYVTARLRVSLHKARDPAGGMEYLRLMLTGVNVPIPALQKAAREHGVKVNKLKPRDRRDTH